MRLPGFRPGLGLLRSASHFLEVHASQPCCGQDFFGQSAPDSASGFAASHPMRGGVTPTRTNANHLLSVPFPGSRRDRWSIGSASRRSRTQRHPGDRAAHLCRSTHQRQLLRDHGRGLVLVHTDGSRAGAPALGQLGHALPEHHEGHAHRPLRCERHHAPGLERRRLPAHEPTAVSPCPLVPTSGVSS